MRIECVVRLKGNDLLWSGFTSLAIFTLLYKYFS